MPSRTDMRSRRSRRAYVCLVAGLLAAALIAGNGPSRATDTMSGRPSAERATAAARAPRSKVATSRAPSDSAALRAAAAMPDTNAQLAALREFLSRYPHSPLRIQAYGRILDWEFARNRARAEAFAHASLKSEREPGARGRLHAAVYYLLRAHLPPPSPAAVDSVIQAFLADSAAGSFGNLSIGLDLFERHERSDQALRMVEIGAARAGSNAVLRAACLDLLGRIEVERGEHAKAIVAFEQARALMNPAQAEKTLLRLAAAYNAVGRKTEARGIYQELMVSQESPAIRGLWEALTRELHLAPDSAARALEDQRWRAARPAPDFTLTDLGGGAHRLSDLAGKVVLLDFWSPT